MSLWWLSFASDEGNLGVCVVEAESAEAAYAEAKRLGINPGGELIVYPVDDSEGLPLGVLVRPDEMFERGYMTMGQHEERGEFPSIDPSFVVGDCCNEP